MSASPRLALPFITPSQAQKHVTHNEALQRIDALAQLVLEEVGAETPPAVPANGAIWALGPAPTGSWAGQGGMLAQWVDPAWLFLAPQAGWRAWDKATGAVRVFEAGAWAAVVPELQNIDGIGIATAWDATNRLALASEASLFTHAGNGHQVKVNKSAVTDTASLLFQTGWSGRAEMGTTGTDDFSIKVSPDGSAWTEAMRIAADTGLVGGAAVQASATDITAGRLARADYAYGPGNLLGSVSQSGGTPTGAVIESGSNANGKYVRFADGTQICWNNNQTVANVSTALGQIFESPAGIWTFPAVFTSLPAVSFDGGDTRIWGTSSIPGATSCAFRLFTPNSVGSSQEVRTLAVGKWF